MESPESKKSDTNSLNVKLRENDVAAESETVDEGEKAPRVRSQMRVCSRL